MWRYSYFTETLIPFGTVAILSVSVSVSVGVNSPQFRHRERYCDFKTRMHSSRMCTARLSPYRGEGLPNRDPPDRDPLDGDPPRQRPPRQRPPWTETPSGHVTCGACWDRDPPYEQNDWQTGIKTLPCCNFVAGGNRIEADVGMV